MASSTSCCSLATAGSWPTSETYESKESCLKGIDAVKRLAADAAVIEAETPPAATATKGAASARKSTVSAR